MVDMAIPIPAVLSANCRKSPDRMAWLDRLPSLIRRHCQRRDGTHAILKIGMPHFEAQNEIDGLRYWCGDPTVLLLEEAAHFNAMLLNANAAQYHSNNIMLVDIR